MSLQTTELEIGTFTASLAMLAQKGVDYATVIDVGCADGSFFLEHCLLGMFPDCVPVNIDANSIYEPSLKAMQEVLGGHYLIAAVADRAGEAMMTNSVHPYWNSLRAPNDPYWQRINALSRGQTTVAAVTLDQVAAERALAPPFLLKLDVQGAEAAALRGARHVLAETNVVICEADIDDFHAINRVLDEAGFDLFDLTSIARLPDHSVGWFYPVYLNRRLNDLRDRSFWPAADNEEAVRTQIERRRELLTWQGDVLAKIRASRAAPKKP
jgi:FkbM family methyltransferase